MKKFIQSSIAVIAVVIAAILFWFLRNPKPEAKTTLPVRVEPKPEIQPSIPSRVEIVKKETAAKPFPPEQKKPALPTVVTPPQTSTVTTPSLPIPTEPLSTRLLSPDPNISKSAESELPKLSKDEKNQLAGLILKEIKDENDPALQNNIADRAGIVLVRLGPSAFPALILGLDDSVAVVRMKSAYALGELGAFAEAALPPLIRNTKFDKNVFARCDAIDAVGKIGSLAEGAVPTLMSYMEDPNKLIRFHIVEALGNIGPKAKDSILALIKVLKEDPDIDVRANAARSLGQMGPLAAPAVPDLIAASQEKPPRLRAFSLAALRQIGTREAIAAINDSKH